MPYANIEQRREAVRKSRKKARLLRGPVPIGRPKVSEERRKETRKKAYKAHIDRYPERYSARNILNSAIRRGVVIPQLCWICGNKAEGHHVLYDLPLDVSWLCKKHHKEVHDQFSYS